MDIGWSELRRTLGAAFALYLVIEGVLPFFNPAAAQNLMKRLAAADQSQLRWGGFVSIIAGLGLLWMVRHG
ncbi:MAG: DUF2065 domain-containing protein [Gammaproteobacteria bacterium]|nr:DUF2065 domain-containing protein [Gammaproteobacteria bacterium]MDE2349593.1 DUF2065 domain-containing protein [Gammaproteobacteria bacterium]